MISECKTFDFRMLSHHSRDPKFVNDQLAKYGWEATPYVDRTNWGKTKTATQHAGQHDSFRGIIGDDTEAKWIVMLADDVELCQDFDTAIKVIFNSAPDDVNIINLYHPTNKEYKEAHALGHHVFQAFKNFWMQAFCIRPALGKKIGIWMDNYVQRGVLAEDGIVPRYISRHNIPAHAILPSPVQHVGHYRSVFGNPARSGRYIRQSFSYRRKYDFTAIDWAKEWANPYVSTAKHLDKTGLAPGA